MTLPLTHLWESYTRNGAPIESTPLYDATVLDLTERDLDGAA